MKKQVRICAAAVLAALALTGCSTGIGIITTATQTETITTGATKTETGKKEAAETVEAPKKARNTASEEIAATAGRHHVRTDIKDYGTIPVEPYGDEALIMMANFLKPAKDGFCDGLTFHRIISSFMAQDDDPPGAGTGSFDQEIEGEFSSSGVKNPLSHTRGVISMTRSQIKDSTSSQLFTVRENSTFLNGDYACFGYVTKSIEVVDAICKDTKVEDNSGSVVKDDQPVIESIGVADQ